MTTETSSTNPESQGVLDHIKEHPYRWVIASILAVLFLVAAVGSAVGRWAHDTLLDTESWVEVVGPISSDEAVSAALTDAVSEELIDWLEPTQRLENLLPPVLAPLAESVGEEVEGLIVETTDDFFHSELFDELWVGINRTAHTAAVAIIRDQLPFASTEGGVVALDLEPLLAPIIDEVIVRLRALAEAIPDVILDQIDADEVVREFVVEYETNGLPDRFNNVVVYESDRLATVQQAVALFDRLVVILPILALALATASVLVAPSRMIMLIVVIGGAALSWLLSIAIVNWIVNNIISGITSDNAVDVAEALLTGITSDLFTILWVLVVIAVVLGVASFFVLRYIRSRDAESIAV